MTNTEPTTPATSAPVAASSTTTRVSAPAADAAGGGMSSALDSCRLGYIEYDGSRYCFKHHGRAYEYGRYPLRCDLRPSPALRLRPSTPPNYEETK